MEPVESFSIVSRICGIADRTVQYSVEDNDKLMEHLQRFGDKMSVAGQSVEFISQNRSTTTDKAKLDQIAGKKGEYFVSTILKRDFGIITESPETEIRTSKNKGWVPDLFIDEIPVHVKTCYESTRNYCGDSWTWNWKNKYNSYGRDPLFDLPDDALDLIALVYIPIAESRTGTVRGILPWAIVKDYLSLPRKKELKELKRCLYYSDIVENKSVIAQILRTNY